MRSFSNLLGAALFHFSCKTVTAGAVAELGLWQRLSGASVKGRRMRRFRLVLTRLPPREGDPSLSYELQNGPVFSRGHRHPVAPLEVICQTLDDADRSSCNSSSLELFEVLVPRNLVRPSPARTPLTCSL